MSDSGFGGARTSPGRPRRSSPVSTAPVRSSRPTRQEGSPGASTQRFRPVSTSSTSMRTGGAWTARPELSCPRVHQSDLPVHRWPGHDLGKRHGRWWGHQLLSILSVSMSLQIASEGLLNELRERVSFRLRAGLAPARASIHPVFGMGGHRPLGGAVRRRRRDLHHRPWRLPQSGLEGRRGQLCARGEPSSARRDG
jgi:hypothetical protein